MSRCNPAARWGPGTTCEKPVNTAVAREMEQRLAAMQKERENIDKMWQNTVPEEKKDIKKEQYENSKYITFRSSK